MYRLIYGVSSLLFGMGILLVGAGLLNTLLPVRASLEGFSDFTIGVVMSAYYVGFIVGTVWCGRIIRRVGHIRGFASFAATATVSILVNALVVGPVAWTILRALVGASLIGIYISVESWLNERAEAGNRGRIMGLYEMVVLGAMAGGQFLLTFGDIRSPLPFVLAAALFAAGLVPVALTRLPEPQLEEGGRFSLRSLLGLSPVAVAGTLAGGAVGGAFTSLGPVYARDAGLDPAGIAAFMSAALLGGALLQWPIGALSDRVDRRIVIGATGLLGALSAFGIVLAASGSFSSVLGMSFVFGGTSMTLYALSVAHANDLLRNAQFLDAARGFNLLYGVGAAAAPPVVGALMTGLGAQALFWSSLLLLALLGAFALLRAMVTDRPPVEGREEFVPVATPSPEVLEMHPHERLPEGPEANRP
jgi:MFS family permease